LDCGSLGAVEYRPEEVNGSKGLGSLAQASSLGDCILRREV
jgi:hypothetical protein